MKEDTPQQQQFVDMIDVAAPARRRSYRVTWEIDVDDAAGPIDAARKALAHIKRAGSIAHVFTCEDVATHRRVEVDLNERRVTPR